MRGNEDKQQPIFSYVSLDERVPADHPLRPNRRRSAIDRRTTRHPGYHVSQRRRPLIEKVFGWLKQVGGLRKVKLRGLEKVGWLFQYAAAAYNLWRIPKLQAVET